MKARFVYVAPAMSMRECRAERELLAASVTGKINGELNLFNGGDTDGTGLDPAAKYHFIGDYNVDHYM